MKTSVNIPDWLHDEVRQLAGETPFGEQVRDALLIALPLWRSEAADAPLKRALKAKLREIEARPAASPRVQEIRRKVAATTTREARAKLAPASARARPRTAGKRSATKAAKPSPPPARSPRKRA